MKKMILTAPVARRRGRRLEVEWVSDEKKLLFDEQRWNPKEPMNRNTDMVEMTLDEFETLAKFVAELCRTEMA